MKHLLTISLLLCLQICQAQLQFGNFKYKGDLNFNEIKNKADSFFLDGKDSFSKNDTLKQEDDNDFVRYKRWEWYWKNRVNEDGSFPDLLKQANYFNQYKTSTQARTSSISAPWVNISQTSSTGGYNGMGRLTSIAFHPTHPSIFWVGAPIGGIWKTIDGGLTYSPLGDGLPYCSVGNILVDPTNPNILYITLGDHGGWWNYGLGVYKSTDGGLSWNATGMISNFSDGVAYYAMAMSPTNPNIIFLANSDGLFRTANAGITWSMIRSGAHNDVKFRPNDSTTVYACSDNYWGSSEVYKSTNGGLNFSQISSFSAQFNSIQLTVTPANPNILGILLSGSGLKNYYKSSSNGANINLISALPENGIIYLSPLDSNKVYSGFTKIHQSVNGGATWTQLTNWYNDGVHPEVHADHRFVSFNPLDGLIYFCNDGGLSNYDEVFNSWGELNNTLIITQFYTIAVSQSDPIFMIGGTQDNGGRKRTGLNTWAATNGGDAMETAIDQSNNQTIYTTYINGKLYRSLDQWTNDTYNEITPANASGNWVTPYTLDPANQFTILAGYEDVYKSTNRGNSWTKISTNLTGSPSNKLDELEIAPSNSNIIYASRENLFYSTLNGGTTWTTSTIPFATSNFSSITSIAIDPLLPSHVYVTVGGYSAGKKVYKSVNNGTTWLNISGTLPNIPVSASVFDEASPNHELYIGTDIGVFYINDTNSTWTYHGSNLPNTSITDLKIQYATHKLRAATYGRGIWEADLLSIITATKEQLTFQENNFTLAYNPVGDLLLINAFVSKDRTAQLKIYDASGKIVLSNEKHFPPGNYQVPIDISLLKEGIYFIRIEEATKTVSLKFVRTSVK